MLFLKTFSQPLSPEEEQFYLKRYKEGDLEARNVLIERNLRLVAHIVKKYQGMEEETEDLISIGTIGLIKAVTTFDAEKGKLATYAARCIENELLMLFRSRRKLAKETSLYEPIGNDKEGNVINLIDVMESIDEDPVETMQTAMDCRRVAALVRQVLTPREREIVIMRYGLGGGKEVTQREIGAKLGISRSYVSRIEKRALEKLRDSFKEEM